MRKIIGPTPFEPLSSKRPFKHGISEWSQNQLDALLQTDWPAIKERWDNNRDLAEQYAATLSRDAFFRGKPRQSVIMALKTFQKELKRRYPDQRITVTAAVRPASL